VARYLLKNKIKEGGVLFDYRPSFVKEQRSSLQPELVGKKDSDR